jgi:hypothetical protein
VSLEGVFVHKQCFDQTNFGQSIRNCLLDWSDTISSFAQPVGSGTSHAMSYTHQNNRVGAILITLLGYMRAQRARKRVCNEVDGI